MKKINEIADTYSSLNSQGNRYTSGFKYLDKLTDGMSPGLTIIGGRNSMGKTAFSLNMAFRQSTFANIPVAVFSCRFNELQILTRLVALALKAPVDDVRWSLPELLKEEGARKMTESPLYLSCDYEMTEEQLIEGIKDSVRQYGVKVVYVNDLQSIAANMDHVDSENEVINDITWELHKLSRQLGISIVLLSQISRDADDNRTFYEINIPTLRLLPTEIVENVVDNVILVYRPEYYNVFESQRGYDLHNLFFIIVAKNSGGKNGSAVLNLNHDSLTLTTCGYSYEGQYDNILDDMITPYPDAIDDYDVRVPEYKGQKNEEIEAWHRAQEIIRNIAESKPDVKELANKLGINL